MKYDVIIIGGGQAGSMLAISLRQLKFLGSILIISNENYLPYQRPPLSKNFLSEDTHINSLYFKSSAYYEKNNIDISLNSAVNSVNRINKSIKVEDGSKFYYKKLVIATGSKLNRLDLNCDNKNIFYLRTIDDSVKIKDLLDKRQKFVIIGAGYIGLEIAAAASKKNHQISVLESDNRVMSRSVCPETSRFFEKMHETKGVSFYFNTSITRIDQYDNKKIINLKNDTSINTDAIIIGVGVKPKIELAHLAGIDCNNGISVNKYCQTSDDDIFAIGDCANYPNSTYGKRLRLESVQNAIEQAKIVAAMISELEIPEYQVPWFWSDQYDTKLRIAGITAGYEDYIIRGDINEKKFSVFYLKNGRLIALESVNDNKSFSIGKKLIQNQKSIPIDVIRDKDSDLKNWLS